MSGEADHLVRAEHILDTLSDGVAVLDASLTIVWANPAFRRCAGQDAVGRPLVELLGAQETLTVENGVFAAARAGDVGTARLACGPGRFLDLSDSKPGCHRGRPGLHRPTA